MNKKNQTTIIVLLILAGIALYFAYKNQQKINAIRRAQTTPGAMQRRALSAEEGAQNAHQDYNTPLPFYDPWYQEMAGGGMVGQPNPGGINIPAGPIVQPQSRPFLGSR